MVHYILADNKNLYIYIYTYTIISLLHRIMDKDKKQKWLGLLSHIQNHVLIGKIEIWLDNAHRHVWPVQERYLPLKGYFQHIYS